MSMYTSYALRATYVCASQAQLARVMSTENTLLEISLARELFKEVSKAAFVDVPLLCICHLYRRCHVHAERTVFIQINLKTWIVLQGLIGKLSKGDLPLVKASGPFGCPQGPKWAAHRVLVIFAGGIGVCRRSECPPLCCCAWL